MKKVAFVITTPIFGGPHNQALRLHGPLRKLGWEQIVLLTDEPGNAAERLSEAGIPVKRIRLHRLRRGLGVWGNLSSIKSTLEDIVPLADILRAEDIDVVQFAGIQNFHVALAAKRAKIPVVCQILGDFAPFWLRLIMTPIVNQNVDVVMVVSRKILKKYPGIRENKSILFLPPVDVNLIRHYLSSRVEIRKELGIPKDGICVITLGNFVPVKNHTDIVSMAALLCDKYPSLYVRILGSYPLDQRHRSKYEKDVIEKARIAGLFESDRLRFIEVGSRALELLSAGDIFVLSSIAEGIPTAMLEAMAAGMPVVATDVGSVKEVLDAARAGIVVPKRKPELLAKEVAKLIEDSELRKLLSRNSLQFAFQNFDLNHVAKLHAEAYEIALSKGTKARFA